MPLHTHAHAHSHTCPCLFTHTPILIHTHAHACLHACPCSFIHMPMVVHMHAHASSHACPRLFTRMPTQCQQSTLWLPGWHSSPSRPSGVHNRSPRSHRLIAQQVPAPHWTSRSQAYKREGQPINASQENKGKGMLSHLWQVWRK